MKPSLAFILALLGCSLFMLLGAKLPASQSAAQYVGSETCKGCHEEQWAAFQKNPHHRAEIDSAVVADKVGCESCHGPGSLHAEAGGDRSNPGFASIRNFKTMPAEEASEICASCHKGGEQFYWQHSSHARNDVA